jgi:peptidoglycan/xylan/chitin deacetylase (PgdA/CDA1 family)
MIYDPIVRSGLQWLSPTGQSARLSILIFHRVLPEPDPLFPSELDSDRFDTVVSWLNQWFNLLPLEHAVDSLIDGNMPARAACITFDDGYADNVTTALPIIKKHKVPATFFIATGYLNGGRMWNDTIIETVRSTELRSVDAHSLGAGQLPTTTIAEKRGTIGELIRLVKYRSLEEREEIAADISEQCRVDLPDHLMMNDAGVRELHESGMGIGAHTVDHPILRLCDDAETIRQISESREYLQAITGDEVPLFAYPNGKPGTDYRPDQARLVESLGFKAAVSTAPGTSRKGDDLFQLRRFTPWDRSRYRFAARLALNLRR